MSLPRPILKIDQSALIANWHALNKKSNGKAGAVVKADAYGLGVDVVAPALWKAGARSFFVADPFEALELKETLPEAIIYDFSGFSMQAPAVPGIIPVINNLQMIRELDQRPFALQFDTGMTRLGLDISALGQVSHLKPSLVMSHLACGDDLNDQMNMRQKERFLEVTAHFPQAQRSLAATGGILLGRDYHFDCTRPGIGIYGGVPFLEARSVVQISLPLMQIRDISAGTKIGYSAAFSAPRPMRIATVFGGYADGIRRALSPKANLYTNQTACPILGRISMDATTIDVTHLKEIPTHFDLIDETQTINDLANMASTIPYEILTSLGKRFTRT